MDLFEVRWRNEAQQLFTRASIGSGPSPDEISTLPPPWQPWEESLGRLARPDHSTVRVARPPANAVCFADFRTASPAGWEFDGPAFQAAPSQFGAFRIDAEAKRLKWVEPGWLHSGLASTALEGALRSPTFEIGRRYAHIRAAGRESRINVVVAGYTLIRSPIYGGLKRLITDERPHWITFDLDMWNGESAYLEVLDSSAPDPATDLRQNHGYAAIQQIWFSDSPALPETELGEGVPAQNPVSFRPDRDAILSAIEAALHAWTADSLTAAQMALLAFLTEKELLSATILSEFMEQYQQLERSFPRTESLAAITDGTGQDARLFLRGNPRKLGPPVPRRFLEALGGEARPPFAAQASGRFELAKAITSDSNPLFARVMVNRVWHYLFGRGLVASVDNLGALGDPPSHPDLLDWLARWYQENGWSTKRLIRLLVLSRTFQMASRASDARAEEQDPNNLLWHRMMMRRVESEAIRDSILRVSGALNERMYGPSAPVFLTPLMDGRGRPGKTGPLDGGGRRSIYVEVRRNFLSPFMLAYDAPVPSSTVGRRSSSNVPAQALILLNDPFVIQQAQRAAQRFVAESPDPELRLSRVFLSAFARLPNHQERRAAAEFLESQRAAYTHLNAADPCEEKVWADLVHVIFNAKEFIYLN